MSDTAVLISLCMYFVLMIWTGYVVQVMMQSKIKEFHWRAFQFLLACFIAPFMIGTRFVDEPSKEKKR